MEKIKFLIPDGYIVDKEKSTEKELVYIKKDNREITDRINSLGDAIEYAGEDDEDVITYRKMIAATISGHALRYIELVIITKAYNEKWIPDWDNKNERKWWGWWDMTTSGFGVSSTVYDIWGSYSGVGSRLQFLNQEIALYCFRQFKKEWLNYVLLKK